MSRRCQVLVLSGLVIVIAAPARGAGREPPARGENQQTLKLTDTTGKNSFVVTLTESGTADTRLLDYLARSMRIVPVDPKSETAVHLARGAAAMAAAPRAADEITVALRPVSPAIEQP